jgi:hypothetical protein
MRRGFNNLLPPAEIPSEQLTEVRELLDGVELTLEEAIAMADEAIGMIHDIRDELRSMSG